MVFSSLLFICLFLPSVLILYNIFPGVKYKNFIIVSASLLFYGWGEPRYIVLLLIIAVLGFLVSIMIGACRYKRIKRFLMWTDVIINIGALCFFKYADAVIGAVNSVAGTEWTAIGLPIGLSFYVFQSVSYVVDVYKGRVKVQRSLMNYLMYLTMFPQLVAGPIVRYSDIEKQILKRKVTVEKFSEGVLNFVCGMVKKVILADLLSNGISLLLNVNSRMFSTGSAWLGILMYTFRIYYDFSGYSDMAVGLGKMLGFTFPQNFNHPYFSSSISDFWRRWHMTLGSFFRDYVYIPLGGNRRHMCLNLMVVWMLTGIWHGAGLNFLLWGIYYGILIVVEKKFFGKILRKIPYVFRMISTFILVVIGWSVFYFNDINDLYTFMKYAFCIEGNLYNLTTVSTLMDNLWLIIVCILASGPFPNMIYKYLCEKNKRFAAISGCIITVLGFTAVFIMLVGNTYNPFLYFKF